MKNLVFVLTVLLFTLSCTDTVLRNADIQIDGAWKEIVYDASDSLDQLFPVGEVLVFRQDNSLAIQNSYLGHDVQDGNWAFNPSKNIITYGWGGDSIYGIPSIKFEYEMEILTFDNNIMKVNYQQKNGLSKFIRLKRAYQKIE